MAPQEHPAHAEGHRGSSHGRVEEMMPQRRKINDDPVKAMIEYQKYVDELQRRFPDTYLVLKNFFARGNCGCNRKDPDDEYTVSPFTYRQKEDSGTICPCASPDTNCECCSCTDIGAICTCPITEAHCKCISERKECQKRQLEHIVRVYDIHRGKETWGEFLQVREFDAAVKSQNPSDPSKKGGFEELQKRLWSEDFPNPEYGDDAETDEEDSCDEASPDVVDDEHLKRKLRNVSHLITVNHLSANVAKLLGGKFNIPADFFNRHLPGTEPISGRLISRLPSAVQIDFDELYETTQPFESWFPWLKAKDGNAVIGSMMKQNLLFGDIGWNYLSVCDGDFEQSLDHSRLSSGFETLNRGRPSNVFQFSITHRISVYSNPPGHPGTAIVLFYPKLPLCHNIDHYKATLGRRTHEFPEYPLKSPCKLVKFRSVPDTVPELLSVTYLKDNSDVTLEDGSKIPRKSLSYRQMKNLAYPDKSYGEAEEKIKAEYASAYDRELKVHLWEHMRRRGPWKPPRRLDELLSKRHHRHRRHGGHNGSRDGAQNPAQEEELDDNATFVHLFGAPIFKVVAANWARLIVRRSFDLDLLEWRPAERMGKAGHGSVAVEAIKSRRVAIGSHYRDIDASVEVLSGLNQEERPLTLLQRFQETLHGSSGLSLLKLALFETNSQWNRGRSNGFVAGLADEDSWEKIYYDFFELRASVEALSRRADKIQDGIIGLIEVWSGEQSKDLNKIALMFSVLILPFSIAGAIFGADITRQSSSTNGGYLPDKNWKTFAEAVGTIGGTLVFGWALYMINSRAGPRYISPARHSVAVWFMFYWTLIFPRKPTRSPASHSIAGRILGHQQHPQSVEPQPSDGHERKSKKPSRDTKVSNGTHPTKNGIRSNEREVEGDNIV